MARYLSKQAVQHISVEENASREIRAAIGSVMYRMERLWDQLDDAFGWQPFRTEGLPPEHPRSVRGARLYMSQLDRINRLFLKQLRTTGRCYRQLTRASQSRTTQADLIAAAKEAPDGLLSLIEGMKTF